MKKAVEILNKSNIRPTLQRINILNVILKYKNHMSAEDIYKILQRETPTISRATVYNTLNLLSKNGILAEVITPDSVRYDYVEKFHHHFYCEKCKKVYDIHDEFSVPNIKKIDGHIVKNIQYCIVGICKNCLNGGE
ncbi:MAG: Fur family transcriptional regulator, ferric uptake regulator [Thermosipho sp. (in: thermotogales)]|nr:Fur family transcriptional regulator, ferric uptake regulator [Thermosipho sp. (in: thermotogales)]MDN5325234.1 Fur family transcriptional regulator, ferric uptake regulator [Thermosipho sp. (in: thermotogales)]